MDKLNSEVKCILPLVKGSAVSHGKVHEYGQWEFGESVIQLTVFCLKVSGNEELIFKTKSHMYQIGL